MSKNNFSEEFVHPHNHDGNVPKVKMGDIFEILDNEGPHLFKVRMKDGSIAIVAILNEKAKGKSK